jgi:hypothetical protein
VSSCHVTLICHRQEQRTREGGAFIGRKKIYILCIIRWILFSMFSTAESWLATKPRPIFSARQECVWCVIVLQSNIIVCRCVFLFFFSIRFIYSGWLALSLSFFIYPAIIHTHTDRQTTLLFFIFFVFWVMYLFECHILSCIIMVFCWWCRCLFPYNIMYVRLLLYIFFYRERVSI